MKPAFALPFAALLAAGAVAFSIFSCSSRGPDGIQGFANPPREIKTREVKIIDARFDNLAFPFWTEDFHREDCERTGWVFEKSANFLIKYKPDQANITKSVGDCKKHLEAIRKVFVHEFEDHEFTEIPVVRICSDSDYSYFGGPSGSIGYFSPHGRRELHFNGESRYDTSLTRAALNHLAFQQFLWYRFGNVQFGPWYTDGMADYYAGLQFNSSGQFKVKPLGQWAPLIDRVTPVKESLKKGELATIDQLIRFTRQDIYSNPSIYNSQAWSFIYFLREGEKLGHAPFKPEWNNILKDYLETVVETNDSGKAVEFAFRNLKGAAMAELETSYHAFIKELK
ncbi:MAG: hypothetical protein ACKVS6_05510 [Planctomycetota bacterium]